MALALTRLAEQIAPGGSEDIHALLVGRDLHLKIGDEPGGVTITVSTEPIPDPAPDGSLPGTYTFPDVLLSRRTV